MRGAGPVGSSSSDLKNQAGQTLATERPGTQRNANAPRPRLFAPGSPLPPAGYFPSASGSASSPGDR
jgi:hypothetical protein